MMTVAIDSDGDGDGGGDGDGDSGSSSDGGDDGVSVWTSNECIRSTSASLKS
ncbi:hypothetical protein TWF506_005656 [Arthrobotrys conoides]|uniref:Uncharacterized protein n=1 Tax=Arthrobotrys conoides TaxID=74498 RepID=A0AAN8NK40_9PEZI